jgi:2-hydroxy-3-keto-5-methylthiopentenyl-1-phosphate phosphatase
MDKDCERSRIFFCDFDGTISVEDIGHNLVKGVSKNFNQLNPKRIDFVPRSALI